MDDEVRRYVCDVAGDVADAIRTICGDAAILPQRSMDTCPGEARNGDAAMARAATIGSPMRAAGGVIAVTGPAIQILTTAAVLRLRL